jgi:hypothetical protein
MKGDFSRWSFNRPKHYHGVLKQQGRVDLDADWNEQGAITSHRIEAEAIDVIGPSGAPAGDAGFLLTPVNNGTSLTIAKGRAYVDGILCENEQDLPINAQPDLPGFQLPTASGTYLAYLEVWLRHVTALDDQAIAEEALGGPDTCTRARTLWQVKLLPASQLGSKITCSTPVPAWAASTGSLKAQAQPNPSNTDPCIIPATAGYQSLENQLYRVEIHDPGDISSGTVTFKWSRDNGSVVTSWTAQSGNNLTVTSVGPDSVLGLAAGQWVEATDDTHELNFQPGTLAQITNVEGLSLTINQPAVPIAISSFPLNPKIRRWDSPGLVPASRNNWINLENGVQVQFGSGTYATGDYWLIPARTLTANIDWPVDPSSNPVFQPPRGIERHYCPLAILQFDGKTWSVTSTCLPIFDPITSIGKTAAIHVTDVLYKKDQTSYAELLNDSSLLLSSLIEVGLGIRVLCDAPVDPTSAQPATCILTVDLPYPADVLYPTSQSTAKTAAVIGYQTLILPVQVSVTNTSSGGQIDLSVNPGIARVLSDLVAGGLASRLLARLVLKGSFIWALGNPTMYLDGMAFGAARQDPDGTHIGLRLPPSGNGTPGSDFAMWFWLTRPISLVSLTFTPASITIQQSQSSTGTVTLDAIAPAGGAQVKLSPSPAGIATLNPNPLVIPEGAFAGTFTATNRSVTQGSVTLTVTASYSGSSATATGSLTIASAPKPTG